METSYIHYAHIDSPSIDTWELHRDRIVQLFENHNLEFVCAQMATERGLKATCIRHNTAYVSTR